MRRAPHAARYRRPITMPCPQLSTGLAAAWDAVVEAIFALEEFGRIGRYLAGRRVARIDRYRARLTSTAGAERAVAGAVDHDRDDRGVDEPSDRSASSERRDHRHRQRVQGRRRVRASRARPCDPRSSGSSRSGPRTAVRCRRPGPTRQPSRHSGARLPRNAATPSRWLAPSNSATNASALGRQPGLRPGACGRPGSAACRRPRSTGSASRSPARHRERARHAHRDATRPRRRGRSASAVAASTRSPSSTMRFAQLSPTFHASHCVPPAHGSRPTLASGSAICACSSATRRSHAMRAFEAAAHRVAVDRGDADRRGTPPAPRTPRRSDRAMSRATALSPLSKSFRSAPALKNFGPSPVTTRL